MQRAFLSLFLLLLVSGLAVTRAAAQTAGPRDTIVIRLPNQAVLTLMVRNTAQLRELKKYQLDSLTSRLATYINQAELAAKSGNSAQVTMEFYPAKDQPGKNMPEQIRITAHKPAPGYGPSNKVEVLLEKKTGLVINIDGNNTTVRAPGTSEQRQAHRDSVRLKAIEKHSTKSSLIFDLGLNALVNQKSSAGQSDVDLRTEGSRYVNIGLDWDARLGGKHSPLSLTVGPEFAFNNYMLSGNRQWVDENGRTSVILNREGRQYQKTKLATSSINLPLMLRLQLRDTHYKPTFTIGAGGFVGYRIKSWTKVKYTSEGNTYKDKQDGGYNMENFQYGLQGTIGYAGLEFFGKYNMNSLFKTNAGPNTQVLSFGVRVVGID